MNARAELKLIWSKFRGVCNDFQNLLQYFEAHATNLTEKDCKNLDKALVLIKIGIKFIKKASKEK